MASLRKFANQSHMIFVVVFALRRCSSAGEALFLHRIRRVAMKLAMNSRSYAVANASEFMRPGLTVPLMLWL